MGPWLHGNRNTTFSGDIEFGPAATIDGNVTARLAASSAGAGSTAG